MRETFALRVKKYREEKKLSQQDLSYWSGISIKKIIMLENGRMVPNIKMVNNISVALGAQLLDLMSLSSIKKILKIRVRD